MATLIEVSRRATVGSIQRVATKPNYWSKPRRLDEKAHRGKIKRGRSAGTEAEWDPVSTCQVSLMAPWSAPYMPASRQDVKIAAARSVRV